MNRGDRLIRSLDGEELHAPTGFRIRRQHDLFLIGDLNPEVEIRQVFSRGELRQLAWWLFKKSFRVSE